jgi:hypothetical protein
MGIPRAFNKIFHGLECVLRRICMGTASLAAKSAIFAAQTALYILNNMNGYTAPEEMPTNNEGCLKNIQQIIIRGHQ